MYQHSAKSFELASLTSEMALSLSAASTVNISANTFITLLLVLLSVLSFFLLVLPGQPIEDVCFCPSRISLFASFFFPGS